MPAIKCIKAFYTKTYVNCKNCGTLNGWISYISGLIIVIFFDKICVCICIRYKLSSVANAIHFYLMIGEGQLSYLFHYYKFSGMANCCKTRINMTIYGITHIHIVPLHLLCFVVGFKLCHIYNHQIYDFRKMNTKPVAHKLSLYLNCIEHIQNYPILYYADCLTVSCCKCKILMKLTIGQLRCNSLSKPCYSSALKFSKPQN